MLCALEKNPQRDSIWMNGDVVFDERILEPLFKSKESCMLVNSDSVAEEEVKYNLNKDGTIKQVSKEITDGVGEAVGINKISKEYTKKFIEALKQCKNQDYFEKAIETLIGQKVPVYPIDILSKLCIEVDFKEDLDLINQKL